MKTLALAALLAALPAFAMAQTPQPSPRSGTGGTITTDTGRAAAPNAPGQQMQSKGSVSGEPGASGYAPGHKMQARGSMKGKPGASGYAPGQKKTTQR
ncbi:hypothetical protein [Bosea sp. CS1GBMeth4]|uniref:hypothetical protein n=1 Tax=Bosea sp. CS1GBMeth4 TaxID=1892849 RepID=UPI001FCEAA1F|nr:hypothetical protein [Bosea sp. CS1GBMeth4]